MPKMEYMEVEDDLEVVENNGNLGKMLEKKMKYQQKLMKLTKKIKQIILMNMKLMKIKQIISL